MSRTYRQDFYGTSLNSKAHRDCKKWYKPPSWYKRMRRQIRRAQEHQALLLVVGGGEMPIFKHDDQWNWT